MKKLAVMVIGQSPRLDVEAEVQAVVGQDIQVHLQGALDGLSRSEIDALPPRDDGDTLFTRLPNGDGVKISKAAVIRHGEARLAAMTAAGYDVVMVLCTGAFPQWSEKFRIVFPDRIMAAFVSALHPGGKLGIFTPLPAQAKNTTARWQRAGYDVAVIPLSPNATTPDIAQAATEMASYQPTLLVFDCISYTSACKRQACSIVGVPGILAVTAAARAASELI